MAHRTELRARRLELGLTQQQVAEKLGVTAAFYGMVEVGKRTPRLATAFEIARIMRAKVQDLFPDATSSSSSRTGKGNA